MISNKFYTTKWNRALTTVISIFFNKIIVNYKKDEG